MLILILERNDRGMMFDKGFIAVSEQSMLCVVCVRNTCAAVIYNILILTYGKINECLQYP